MNAKTHVIDFFNSWIEIIYHEHVINVEHLRYQENNDAIHSDRPEHEFHLKTTKQWVSLENMAIRLEIMWERLADILWFYFLGSVPSFPKSEDWNKLDKTIRETTNDKQLQYYELFYKAYIDFNPIDRDKNNRLKEFRHNIIHGRLKRPYGVVSTSDDDTFPQTTNELLNLINIERSNFREAVILLTAIIRFKLPLNTLVTQQSE